ncbi:MAG: helix-turn-helix domain-containing protein [Ruminococcaceae bacterium]|nr:helix-turn-helix domain-containing protein [Oscillospiraceae bacterium]
MSQTTLGQSIRRYRKEKNMTQSELAERLGVSVQAVSKWETDKGMPDVNQLLPLSRLLGMSVDLLLGGDRRKELEERFQKALPWGEEFTLLVSLDALKEFPEDATFRYRLACDEKFLGEREASRSLRDLYLNRAAIHFRELHNEYPEDEVYTSMLAETLFAMNQREEAMNLASACKDPQRAFERFFGEGEEKRRLGQEKLLQDMMSLYGRLYASHSREAFDIARTLVHSMLGEDLIYAINHDLDVWEAELCHEEGNIEGFVSAMTKAYEAVEAYDRIPFGTYPYQGPLFDLLNHEVKLHGALQSFLCEPLLSDPALEPLQRRIMEEEITCHKLWRHEFIEFFDFCRRLTEGTNCLNFSISFDKPYHEEVMKDWMNRYPGYAHEALLGSYQAAVTELVGGGIMGGFAAYIGNRIYAYCNCGAKGKYKCLPISEEERAIPTAPEGSKILSIVEIMTDPVFERVGLMDKLLAATLAAAKKKGYTHAEAYPLERMAMSSEAFESLLSCYERAGFVVVRDLSNKQDGRYFIMQKELR